MAVASSSTALMQSSIEDYSSQLEKIIKKENEKLWKNELIRAKAFSNLICHFNQTNSSDYAHKLFSYADRHKVWGRKKITKRSLKQSVRLWVQWLKANDSFFQTYPEAVLNPEEETINQYFFEELSKL